MAGARPGDAGRPEVVVDLTGCRWADLALVDLLARIRLAAHRRGAAVVVVPGNPALPGLLELLGLRGVVALRPAQRQPAGSEPGGQAEALEEPRIEEMVDVGDFAVAQFEHLDRPGREPLAGPGGLVLGEAGRPVDVEGQQP